MKNKYLKGLLFGVLIALTSCGANKHINFVVPEGGYDGSEVTIQFYNTMGTNLTPVLDEYIEKFNVEFPKIHVNYTSIGGWDDVRDQILTEITEGNQPNLAYCYSDHVAAYNLAGAVTTLDGLIESKENKELGGLGLSKEQIEDFIPGYYAEGAKFGDDLMYTLPFSKSTELLFYNETFFTKNNIPVPDHWFSTGTDDKTSMEAVCAAIKAIDPTGIPLGYDSEANWFITMCEQQKSPYTSATGEHFLFNNDTNKATMKKFRSWYEKGWVTTQTIFGNYTNICTTSQNIYMAVGSSAGAVHQRPAAVDGVYPFNVGISPIPQMDQKNKKVISQGPSICIFQKENPQEVIASWLFLKYLTTSVDFQAAFSLESGYVPCIQSVNNNEIYASNMRNANGGDNIASLSAKVCLEQADYYFTSPAFNGSSTARDQVGNLLVRCLSEKTDNVDKLIDDAFAEAIDECEYAV